MTKILIDKSVLEQVIEDLNYIYDLSDGISVFTTADKIIGILRAALQQQQQHVEPTYEALLRQALQVIKQEELAYEHPQENLLQFIAVLEDRLKGQQ